MLGVDTIKFISAYAPQVALNGVTKDKLWEEIDELMQGILDDQQIFIGGDLNGHVGKSSDGYSGVYKGYGSETRNKEWENILNFCGHL